MTVLSFAIVKELKHRTRINAHISRVGAGRERLLKSSLSNIIDDDDDDDDDKKKKKKRRISRAAIYRTRW